MICHIQRSPLLFFVLVLLLSACGTDKKEALTSINIRGTYTDTINLVVSSRGDMERPEHKSKYYDHYQYNLPPGGGMTVTHAWSCNAYCGEVNILDSRANGQERYWDFHIRAYAGKDGSCLGQFWFSDYCGRCDSDEALTLACTDIECQISGKIGRGAARHISACRLEL